MRIFRSSLVVTVIAGLLQASAALGADDEVNCFVKKGTWEASMIASRQSYRDWMDSAGPSARLEWSAWRLQGPVKFKSFKESLGAPNLEEGKWKERPDLVDGVVHNLQAGANQGTLLHRTIEVKKACKINVSLGSDDGFAIWLDGKLLASKDVPRGPGPDQDRVTLDLSKGRHDLVFMPYNRGGGHGFFFSSRKDPVHPLWKENIHQNKVRFRLYGSIHAQPTGLHHPHDLVAHILDDPL